nr:MAG TPA: hypothetical protein [Caudoviricetes sp.]
MGHPMGHPMGQPMGQHAPPSQRSSSRYLRASSRAGQIWTSYGAQRR